MARTRDLWFKTVDGQRIQTARHGRGKRWLAVWIDPAGDEASRAFTKKSDADRHGTGMEAESMRGTYVDPRSGSVTLREYGEDKFLPSLVHLRPNSVSTYVSHLRTHAFPLLGDRRMRNLARSDMKAFVAAKSAELAPSTTETVFAVLRALMSAAVDDGVIAVNPCSRVPLPESTPRVLEPLPPALVLALANALPPRYRVGVALGAGAGLRFGEATGLTVPRVQFLQRRLQILEQAQNGALAPLKTKASRRTVPAGDWVLEEVTEHLQRYGAGPLEVVMSNAGSRIIRRGAFGDCWRTAVRSARTCGKPPAGPGERRKDCGEACADPAHCAPAGTRFHDLRHFYASALIADNLNPKVIQTRLGHATMAETMDTYGHLFPDAEDLGRTSIDEALARALAEQGRNRKAL